MNESFGNKPQKKTESKLKRMATGALAALEILSANPAAGEDISQKNLIELKQKQNHSLTELLNTSNSVQEFEERLANMKNISTQDKLKFLSEIGSNLNRLYDNNAFDNSNYYETSFDDTFEALKNNENNKVGVCTNIHQFIARVAEKMGMDSIVQVGRWNEGNHAFTILKVKDDKGQEKFYLVNYNDVIDLGSDYQKANEQVEREMGSSFHFNNLTYGGGEDNRAEYNGKDSRTAKQNAILGMTGTNIDGENNFDKENSFLKKYDLGNGDKILYGEASNEGNLENGKYIGYQKNWDIEFEGNFGKINTGASLDLGILKYNMFNRPENTEIFGKVEAYLDWYKEFGKMSVEAGTKLIAAGSYNLDSEQPDGTAMLKSQVKLAYDFDKYNYTSLTAYTIHRFAPTLGEQLNISKGNIFLDKYGLNINYTHITENGYKLGVGADIFQRPTGSGFALKAAIENKNLYAYAKYAQDRDPFGRKTQNIHAGLKYKKNDLSLFTNFNYNLKTNNTKAKVGFSYKF